MNTAYKIYASILNDRLMGAVKDNLQEIQFSFKKRRGTTELRIKLRG